MFSPNSLENKVFFGLHLTITFPARDGVNASIAFSLGNLRAIGPMRFALGWAMAPPRLAKATMIVDDLAGQSPQRN